MADQFFPSIRLRWLVCYLAVTKVRCYKKAADQLGLRPEVVSRDVKLLARAMNLKLVVRGRPLKIVSAHVDFLSVAETILTRFRKMGFSEKRLCGNLDIRWLHTFAAYDATQANAGTLCNLDQSAVSRQLSQLRHWVGKDMFKKSQRPELTSEGLELKALAHETIEDIIRFRDSRGASNSQGNSQLDRQGPTTLSLLQWLYLAYLVSLKYSDPIDYHFYREAFKLERGEEIRVPSKLFSNDNGLLSRLRRLLPIGATE